MREVWACIIGLFLIGLGHLVSFPPFEAQEEAEYYSKIQRFASQGFTPHHVSDYLAKDVRSYASCGIVSPRLAERLDLGPVGGIQILRNKRTLGGNGCGDHP